MRYLSWFSKGSCVSHAALSLTARHLDSLGIARSAAMSNIKFHGVCRGCGTAFGLHEGWCAVCLTKRIAELEREREALAQSLQQVMGERDVLQNRIEELLAFKNAQLANARREALREARTRLDEFSSMDRADIVIVCDEWRRMAEEGKDD